MISPYLDAFRVDIKAFYENSFKKITGVKNIDSILERTIEAKRIGMHVEVVTNVIPTVNDSRKEMDDLSKWIFENLGSKTPWHVTRFYPYQQFSYIEPTPIKLWKSSGKLEKKWIEIYLYWKCFRTSL